MGSSPIFSITFILSGDFLGFFKCPYRLARSRTLDFHSKNQRFESACGYELCSHLTNRLGGHPLKVEMPVRVWLGVQTGSHGKSYFDNGYHICWKQISAVRVRISSSNFLLICLYSVMDSTSDFGSASEGSNPSRGTNLRLWQKLGYTQAVKRLREISR